MTRTLSEEALNLLKQGEALRLFAYPDPASPLALRTPTLRRRWGFEPAPALINELMKAGAMPPGIAEQVGAPWTCGYGHTKGVTPATRCSEAEALEWLDQDLDWAEAAVNRLVKVHLNSYQYGALVSLVFNIGAPAFAKSTLLKRLNEGDYDQALYHFGDFIKVRNRATKKLERNQGLYNRRQSEKAFWVRGENRTPGPAIVEESVEPVSREAVKDPNLMSNYATASGTAGAALSEAAGHFEPIAMYSETIKWVFIALTVASIVFGIWYRTRQRKE